MPLNPAALLLLPTLLSPLLAAAQEVASADTLPPSVRDGYVPPDRILYGSFLRSAAVFEKRAQANEANGLSGDAYRRHLVHKLGITPAEQQQIGGIALRYYDRWAALKDQLKDAARNSGPPTSPEMSTSRFTIRTASSSCRRRRPKSPA